MDHRVKTATVTASVFLLAATYVLPAAARGSAVPGSQSQSTESEEYLTPAQRNPELPKGLTIVPWKLERRPDRIDLLQGAKGDARARSQSTQPAPNTGRR